MTRRKCRRGQIWLCKLPSQDGSEISGSRPVLVIQNDIGNQHAATTIVATITSTLKKYPVSVWLEKGEGGLKQESMANFSQIFTLDRSRLQRKLGTLGKDRIKEVNEAISISLQLVEI